MILKGIILQSWFVEFRVMKREERETEGETLPAGSTSLPSPSAAVCSSEYSCVDVCCQPLVKYTPRDLLGPHELRVLEPNLCVCAHRGEACKLGLCSSQDQWEEEGAQKQTEPSRWVDLFTVFFYHYNRFARLFKKLIILYCLFLPSHDLHVVFACSLFGTKTELLESWETI